MTNYYGMVYYRSMERDKLLKQYIKQRKINRNASAFYNYVSNTTKGEYTVLGKYTGVTNKIKVKHNKCGYVYEITPSYFRCGNRCPQCNQSQGEEMIRHILDRYKIKYVPQKKFSDLKDVRQLSYDFYIPSQNILIEYQGRQHYQSIDYFGGEDRFKNQQKHDQMKLDYAKNKGYKLITIPYTVDTLSNIKNYLINHGL